MITDEKLLNHSDVNYLKDLGCAMKNISSDYFSWKLKNSIDCEKEVYCERVYAYELYHQLRTIMECPVCNGKRYKGLTLNGEAIKSNTFFKDVFDGLSEVNNGDENKFIPDLILHKDLGSFENEGQIYLVEIKMNGNRDYFNDLIKLTNLKKTKLNFDFYIFIYVNINMNEFISRVKTQKKEVIQKINDDIVCFCTEFGDYECKSFGMIKSQINN